MHFLRIIVLTLVISLGGLLLFKKLNILDKPGPDNKKRRGVPTIQGIFAYGEFLGIIALLFPQYYTNHIFLGLIVGGGIIVLFTLFDELQYIGKFPFKIPALVRLVLQVIAAMLAIYIAGIGNQELVVGEHIWMIPQRGFMLFFVIWSILCINAINRFDGIYGQASGVSAVGFLTIFLLIKFVVFHHYPNITLEKEQILLFTQNISLVLCCISTMYTIIEYKPLGLLRDIGTMFFGFAIAYLSVIGGTKIGTLVVALSLVIFDALWVGIHRMTYMKKNPLKGDYTHLHFRLMGLGRTKPEARMFVWIWSIVMMILMLLQGANRINKLIIFGVMLLIFFGVNAYLFWIKKLPCGLPLKKK